MSCEKCAHIIDRQDVPHVIRTCDTCGRTMYVRERGKHGRGIRSRDGDTFVIPSHWLKMAPNPLKGTGRLTRPGIEWFAKLIFLEELPNKRQQIDDELERMEKRVNELLNQSDLLRGHDLGNPEHASAIVETLEASRDTAEWWAFLIGFFLKILRDAQDAGDLEQAVWAMACAERCRSMLVFKEHLEEVVWMGHSARRLVDILNIWKNNKTNGDEEFWQLTFNENSYVLSQVFSVPVVFLKDKAYVGGMNIERKEAKFVDYLFAGESSEEAMLVELKTPITRLLGAKYRGIYKPSAELTGALVQVLDYRNQLAKSIEAIADGTDHNVNIFNPRCLLIVGSGETELDNQSKRRSFELFRSGLQNVEIITYDELFRKVEVLASLFNLVRKQK